MNGFRSRKCVVVELNDGSKRKLDEILTNVINMWIELLTNNNVIINFKLFPLFDENFVPPRENDGEEARLDLTVNSDIGVSIRFQLRRFDYELGKSEPVDLTQTTD